MKVLGRKGKPAAPACQLPAVRGAFSAVSPPCERKKSGKDAGSTALVQAANRLCSSFPAHFIFLAFGAVSEGCPKKEEPHPAPLIPPLQQTHRFLPVSSLTQPHLSPPLPRCHFRARWRGWQEGCPHCLCRDSAPGGKDACGREGGMPALPNSFSSVSRLALASIIFPSSPVQSPSRPHSSLPRQEMLSDLGSYRIDARAARP